jgi:cell division protein ZapA (FtsZ GTPase activity inhibitor)
MAPYYKSWTQDIHGRKLGVRCVDCHYAPGERFTFHAKFKGLSQLTSYFSGRAGQARPRAHLSDASCLTSDCHGDQAYLDKPLMIGEARMEKRIVGRDALEVKRNPTVAFTHRPHLNAATALTQTTRRIETIRARLRSTVAPDRLERLNGIAVSVDPLPHRTEAIRFELRNSEPGETETLVIELATLEDLQVRQQQLAGMTCTGCHFYDPSGNTHLTVDRQTCYTCHFTNQTFNQGTGECLRCHEAPTRMIAVHETSSTQPADMTMMNHQDVVSRKILCSSCHMDVVRGEGLVSARECAHCHDQQSYLTAFADRTLQQVAMYHRSHVAAQRARCPDCHQAIQHNMVEPAYVTTHSGFIDVVRDNCRHCHPNHHREQVALLMGIGGEGITQPMPNAMFGSRLNCQACHAKAGSDFKGDPLIQATAAQCVACHGEHYRNKLDQWIHEIEANLKETTQAADRLTSRVERLRSENREIPEQAKVLLASVNHNLRLVRAGNGIHNKNYALNLLDLSNASIRQAEALLPAP